MTAPYLETWKVSERDHDYVIGGDVPDGERAYCSEPDGKVYAFRGCFDADTDEGASSRAKLAAAAPALARALLAAEWGGNAPYLDGPEPGIVSRPSCPVCGAAGEWRKAWAEILSSVPPWECYGQPGPVERKHAGGCPIDEALTAAGFPDQSSRDEARKQIVAAHALETGAFV